jgi:hypothetical protein
MGMTLLREAALVIRAAPAGAAALGISALLAACGGTGAPSSGQSGSGATGPVSAASTSTGGASASATPTARVSLGVTFAASPGSPAVHYTLFCEPAGGTTPDPAAACAKLLTGVNIFAPRPLHEMCPMILQSGVRATVTGTYLSRQVHMTIVNGGCDIARWAKLKSIFG